MGNRKRKQESSYERMKQVAGEETKEGGGGGVRANKRGEERIKHR